MPSFPRGLNRRKYRRWASFLALIAATGVGFLSACSGSTSSALIPTTGILIRAESLTAGRGCGRAPSNLFKYAVVVYGYTSGAEDDPGSYNTALTGNVFDCFSDGAFIELPRTGGSLSYRLEVFAYNEAAYTPSRDKIETAISNALVLKNETTPTWTTECTATQQQDVQSLAQCLPLAPGTSGLVGGAIQPTRIELPTTTFRLADGRTALCSADGGIVISDSGVSGDADAAQPTDSGNTADTGGGGTTDSGTDSGSGGTDSGSGSDSGADSGADGGVGDAGTFAFSNVRLRYRNASFVGPSVDLACGNPASIAVPAEPAQYDLDVGLLDSNGTPLGQTLCTVTARVGVTSQAVCP